MNNLQLVIGSKNYSSWSLRAWLCLRKSGAAFEEILLPLDSEEFEQRIGDYSAARQVPVLLDDEQCIWDSLAICEYVNELYAQGALWPEDSSSRALGRSMSAQMHSGFSHLRNALPMNIRASNRYVDINASIQADMDAIFWLWGDSLNTHSDAGPWLLGNFSIADAMFAPVVLRFRSYLLTIPEDIQSYCNHVVDDVDMQLWMRDAMAETWIVEADEAGEERGNA